MKLEWLGGVAAIALLATMGSASAITVSLSSSPLCNLGIGTANSFQPGSLPSSPCGSSQPEISSIVFAGGASTGPGPATPSGVYAGRSAGNFTSPFLIGGANPTTATVTNAPTEKYLAAQPGGSVTVTYSTPQSSLAILWGTVDFTDNMNLLIDNGSTPLMITGSMLNTDLLGILAPSGAWGWVRVAGQVLTRGRRPDHSLERFQARRVQISADTDLPRQVDGEIVAPGRTLAVSVCPSALTVRQPR